MIGKIELFIFNLIDQVIRFLYWRLLTSNFIQGDPQFKTCLKIFCATTKIEILKFMYQLVVLMIIPLLVEYICQE